MEPGRGALAHLLDHLRLLELRLARHVALLRATGRFVEDPFRGLFVGEGEVDAIVAGRPAAGPWSDGATALETAIAEAGAALNARAIRSDADGEPGLPLERLAACFALGGIEIAALVAAAAPAFDSRFETLFAYAQNDATKRLPTVALILDLLAPEPQARRDGLLALGPQGTLRAYRLVRPPADARAENVAAQPLALDPALLPFLLGRPFDDALGGGLAMRPQHAPLGRLPWLQRHASDLRAELDRHAGSPTVAALRGPADAGQLEIALAACGVGGTPLAVLDLDHPDVALHDDEALAALVGRALRLGGAALFVDTAAVASDVPRGRLLQLVRRAVRPGRPVFLAGPAAFDEALLAPGTAAVEAVLAAPGEPERRLGWRTALEGEGAPDATALAATLARTTRLGPSGIVRAIARARRRAAPGRWPPADPAALTEAARREAGPTLARLAQLVETRWAWDDLVVPPDQREELDVLAAAVVHGPRVAADWGFAARGLPAALVALFSGPSGTGKTMAAALIARRAGLPLYRVDLSAVVSKYIGETEKQLDRLLSEAESVGAALLFDEADALFGKRADVKDARDRYANQEVAFLLQRIEAFDGLVILTTNLSGHIDTAFLRRIAYAVHFPMPDEGLRAELWRRAFPPEAPLAADLDPALLARTFEIAGGNIRNAALGAAHLAAADDRPIAMRDVIRAVAREVRKLGRLPSRAEFGALYAALAPPGAGP